MKRVLIGLVVALSMPAWAQQPQVFMDLMARGALATKAYAVTDTAVLLTTAWTGTLINACKIINKTNGSAGVVQITPFYRRF